MDNLDHSRLLDVHRISEHPEVQEVIQVLYGELKKSGYLGKSSRKKILKHLKAVILDLYLRYKSDPVSYVAYPRSPNEYLKETRLGQLYFGYRPMMRVIDGLEALGYLETHKGFQNRSTGQSRLSRMRATASLFDLITDHSVTPDMIELEDQPVLVLRDVEGEDIPYKASDETISMETQLHSYNEFLATHQLSLSLPLDEVRAVLITLAFNCVVSLMKTSLEAVGSIRDGGRRFHLILDVTSLLMTNPPLNWTTAVSIYFFSML